MFDAYTIRRVLPRLIIAGIFISLSWPIMLFLIGLSNDIGIGIRAIIYAPFSNINGGQIRIGGGTVGLVGTVGALVGSSYLFTLGLVGMGSLLLTALLAVAIGFIVLLLRQVVIMMLVITAPLAIACYILPGTEKAWKFWRDTLVSMLVAFPIMSAMIAMGRVFAVVMDAAPINGVPKFVNEIGAFILFFLPYFLLLFILKLSGAAVESVTSFVHGKGQNAFQKLSEGRAERRERRKGLASTNSLYANDAPFAKFRNNLASWSVSPYGNAAYTARNSRIPGFSRAGKRIAAGIHSRQMEQTGELLKTLNDKFSYNDKAYRALSGAHDGLNGIQLDAEGNTLENQVGSAGYNKYGQYVTTLQRLEEAGLAYKSPNSMQDVESMANILQNSNSETEKLAAAPLRGSAGYLGNLYSSTDTNKASAQAAAIMGLSSHGFASGEDIATVANQMEASQGHEFAEAASVQAQVIGQRQRPDIKAGYGLVYNNQTKKWESGTGRADGSFSRDLKLIKTISSHDLAGAKAGAIKTLRPAIETTLAEGARAQANITQLEAQATRAGASNDDIKAYDKARAAIGNAQAVKDQVFSWAGPYSQASVDVKAEALDIINRYGGGTMRADFDRRARAEASHDPEAHHGGAPGGDDE